ncbi:hypothetical protein CC2G_001021 [Coprinopsis cinerea AmutBmut pab1-1]|nr:hypothetical protein CC2G_001021 [Coprinopsis cinerea AmutBmut pab1-1]
MIDPFCNEALKRLAQAGDQNIKLQKERDDLERERNELRKQVEELRREASQKRVEAPSPQDKSSVDAVKQLSELEMGIKQAQESYRKIENQLKENHAKIGELVASNQRLRNERGLFQQQCRALAASLESSEANLKDALRQYDELRHQLAHPVKTEAAPVASVIRNTLSPPVEKQYKAQITALEAEVSRLTLANKELQQEKERYRQEAETASQRLSKYRNNDHTLRENLVKLQGELTRKRSTSIHSRDSSIASGSQVDAASIRSQRSTASTSAIPSASSSALSVKQESSSSALAKPRHGASTALPLIDLAQIDEGAGEEDQAPTPRPAYTGLESIPAPRRRELASLPVIIPAVAISDLDNAFSRDFMSNVLGGSIQPLIVSVSKQPPLSKEREVRKYLCPGLDHNPWCPSIPGHHGYIFVGLGREKTTFQEPEIHNVFVGVKKGKENRRFRYLGKYRAVRVNPLTPDEWNFLDVKVRTTYAKTTKDKTKDSRSVEAIMKAYETGELSVPCVMLQCIGFDENLYTALVAQAAKPPASAQWKKTRSSSSSRSNKRALDDYDADQDDSSRHKRRTLTTSRRAS